MNLHNHLVFLGVDAGASKTHALAVDACGQVIGFGAAGPGNYHNVGIEAAVAAVEKASRTALGSQVPDSAAMCMAAADMPYDFATLRQGMKPLAFPIYEVYNDVIGVFRAGSRFPYGVGVVAGTGFNAGGISRDGVEFRFPALGDVTGDCAGGGYLGMAAVGAGFRAWDGRGPATLLMEAVLRALDAPDYETLAERYVMNRLTTPQIRELSPLVFELSERGDAVAQDLIRAQGTEIGLAVNAVLRRLDLVGADCDVVLGGSMIYGRGSLFMDTVRELVGRISPAACVKRLDVSPVVGAVLLAADRVGVETGPDFVNMLHATLPENMQRLTELRSA